MVQAEVQILQYTPFVVKSGVTATLSRFFFCVFSPDFTSFLCFRFFEKGATVVEQILDESDAVGLMQLQCKEAKHDVSVMIFPTTDTLSLQKQVQYQYWSYKVPVSTYVVVYSTPPLMVFQGPFPLKPEGHNQRKGWPSERLLEIFRWTRRSAFALYSYLPSRKIDIENSARVCAQHCHAR